MTNDQPIPVNQMKYPSLDGFNNSVQPSNQPAQKNPSMAVAHDLIDISEPAVEKSAFDCDADDTAVN